MANQTLYRSSFGSVRLWISKLSTDKSRTQVVHETSTGDDHVVQDRGQVITRASGTILFDWMNGDLLSPLDRLNEFQASLDEDSRVFTHPIEGSYNARIGNFKYDIDEHGTITAEVEFIAVQTVRSVVPAGAGSIPANGEGAVEAASDAYAAELGELGIDDQGLADATKASVDAWNSDADPNPRQIYADTGAYSSKLSDQASGMEDDLDAWQAYKSVLLLSEAVRIAAEAATADTATTFILKLGGDVALRSMLAEEYGADEADLRYTQVMRLNDIQVPGLIGRGTELVMPAPRARARNG